LLERGISRKIALASDLLLEYAISESRISKKSKLDTNEISVTHGTSNSNTKAPNITNYAEEARSLTALLEGLTLTQKTSLLSEFRRELDSRGVDHSDCRSEKEVVNRLAYARIFGRAPEPKLSLPQRRSNQEEEQTIDGQNRSPLERIFEEFFWWFFTIRVIVWRWFINNVQQSREAYNNNR